MSKKWQLYAKGDRLYRVDESGNSEEIFLPKIPLKPLVIGLRGAGDEAEEDVGHAVRP